MNQVIWAAFILGGTLLGYIGGSSFLTHLYAKEVSSEQKKSSYIRQLSQMGCITQGALNQKDATNWKELLTIETENLNQLSSVIIADGTKNAALYAEQSTQALTQLQENRNLIIETYEKKKNSLINNSQDSKKLEQAVSNQISVMQSFSFDRNIESVNHLIEFKNDINQKINPPEVLK